MKTKLLLLVVLLLGFGANAQTCNGNTFNSPGAPSTCTYTYTSSGWENASGLPIAAPTHIELGESVCILADNADTIGTAKFKGTLYVPEGVSFTGFVPNFTGGSTLVIEGSVDFNLNPGINDTKIYVHENGFLRVPGQLQPNGTSEIHVLGQLENGLDLNITGQAKMIIYQDAEVTIANGTYISNEVSNCGLFIIEAGEVHTGGSSSLYNLCSTYVYEDLVLDGPYTNDGLFVVKGDLTFNGHTFYNNDVLMVKNLVLNNDDIVGNGSTSVLLVEFNAELQAGATITGHYYYDNDDGGGFDAVCGSCVEDIDVLNYVDMMGTVAEITANCGEAVKPEKIKEKATLDFDGIDDYVSTDSFIAGSQEVTMMGWIKSDLANAGKLNTLFGEDLSCSIYINGFAHKPYFIINTTSSTSYEFIAGPVLPYNEWHHVAASFSALTGEMSLYVDGKLVATRDTGLSGTIDPYSGSTGKFEIGRISRAVANRQYFTGDIDEVRVFNSVLTDEQIQQMVYQEIQNNSGNVGGTVIPKDVRDIDSDTRVSWTNLTAYYPMTDIISYTRTKDYSMYDRKTTLHNITTFLDQTAPMPYETKSSGDWTNENTWLHGDVWDIEAAATNKDWSIVRVNSGHALTSANTHSQLGTIIEEGASFTINNNKGLTNTWYMELNGTLDLTGDSQLVQGENSDLVTSANGKVMRRQDSNGNQFRYTYMSSPVGVQAATTLGNDNAAINNANNTTFSLNMLKEGNGTPMQFTNGYNGNGKISTRWTYTFLNGITYYDWVKLNPATTIDPGVGYIHKGIASDESTLELLFEGRPNNGTILITADDVDGDAGNESQPDVTQTTTLIGNPYPSAIDAHKFIDDNAGVIDGTIYLWQQWAGDNHNLYEYQGGYAVLNKMAKIRAYQFVGMSGADNGSQDGTLTPTQYIGVGQSFMTEVIADGNIEFNNSQRVFKRESVGEVEFFRSNETTEKNAASTEEDTLKILKLEFRLSNDLTREFVLGFSESTTMGYDYGYDAKMFDLKSNDMYTMWEGEKMIAQAYPQITAEMEIPLHMVVTGDQTYEISATEFTNLDGQDVYLWDKYNDTYFDLTAGITYGFTAEAGTYTDRFAIVFQSQDAQDTLSDEEVMLNESLIYFNTNTDRIYIKGLTEDSRRISLIDLSGKTVNQFGEMTAAEMAAGLPITNISSGIYLVSVVTDTNRIINKKLIID